MFSSGLSKVPDRLSTRGRKDPCNLPHPQPSTVRWEWDPGETQELLCPCLSIVCLGKLRSEEESDLPKREFNPPNAASWAQPCFFTHLQGVAPKVEGSDFIMANVAKAGEGSDGALWAARVCNPMTKSIAT